MANALIGLAAAFSPNPIAPPFYFDWPFEVVDGARLVKEDPPHNVDSHSSLND
jgi:hypothetical protein